MYKVCVCVCDSMCVSNIGLRVTDGTSDHVYSMSCKELPPTTTVKNYWRRTTTPYDTETDHETVVILSATGPVLLCVFAVVAVCCVKTVKRRKIEAQNTINPQLYSRPRGALHEPDLALSQYEPSVSHAEVDVNRLTGARPVRPPSYRETPDISTLSYPKSDPPPSYRSASATSRSRAARSDPPPSYRSASVTSRPQVPRSDPPPSYRTTADTPSQR